jgi:hypothetical protein
MGALYFDDQILGARQTNHTFEVTPKKYLKSSKSVEKIYFYCICRTKPPVVFRRTSNNRNILDVHWYNVNSLPRSELDENVANVISYVKNLIYSMNAPPASAPPLDFDSGFVIPPMQASAPPLDFEYNFVIPPMQASAPPLEYDELPPSYSRSSGYGLPHLRQGGRKKNKFRKNIRSSSKYKFSRKYKKMSRKYKKMSRKKY